VVASWDYRRNHRENRGHVVLEPVFTIMQELLLLGISTTPAPPNVSKGSSVKRPFPRITADFAAQIVGGKPREAIIRADLTPADAGAKGVPLPTVPAMMALKSHHS